MADQITARIDSLPPELLFNLIPLLPLTTLVNLSYTCRTLYENLQAELQPQIASLRKLYHHPKYHADARHKDDHSLQCMIEQIMHLSLPPEYITRLTVRGISFGSRNHVPSCSECEFLFFTSLSWVPSDYDHPLPQPLPYNVPQSLGGIEYFQGYHLTNPYLYAQRRSEKIDRPTQFWPQIESGNESAQLAVLLLVLSNLREFHLLDSAEWDEWLCASLRRIAWQQDDFLQAHPSLLTSLYSTPSLSSSQHPPIRIPPTIPLSTHPPLSLLRQISIIRSIPLSLEDTLPFITLPLLQTFHASDISNTTFRYHKGTCAESLPSPRVPHLTFSRSVITIGALEDYARMWNSPVRIDLTDSPTSNYKTPPETLPQEPWGKVEVYGTIEPGQWTFSRGQRWISIKLGNRVVAQGRRLGRESTGKSVLNRVVWYPENTIMRTGQDIDSENAE